MAARLATRIGAPVAITAALLLASCAPKPAPPAAPAPAPDMPAPPVALPSALDPESYMAFAASSALVAARLSDMAEARGSTNKLRKYANVVVREQTGIGAQLSFAGRRIDLLPSARPIPQHQSMLEELATSGDFDGTYLRLMNHVLTEASKAHRAFEASGSSPTLKPVAVFAAPVCERHLHDLRKL